MAASVTPSRIEYDLGKNMHGQPVKLFRENRQWIMIRLEANQRDDTARIELSDEQAYVLAQIFGGKHA